ncbi:uncharacterized protein F4822DRAFT_418328 [Hypoxylon trugodes]|uniref:uncharacterized protein n=1 Tax=Hypoxylon trugodes TaxID=326681 RepID=UPI00218DB306|nr:uncharacterized protein F4822DRAFT_418328 [Hypoxylon trugodes]KAI1384001.1 hypothetical protein F4822DRAFT_418328 [Hypoxylon trugodes]
MAIVGLSLVLVSVVYVAIWKPSFVQTFLALWRGDPRIEQPPTTGRPSPAETKGEEGDDQSIAAKTTGRDSLSPATMRKSTDRETMPPPPLPPKLVTTEHNRSAESRASSSPQTTPKATPSTHLNGVSIPSFSLSPEPPASAAAIARTTDAQTTPSALPTLSTPSPPPQPVISAPALTPASTTPTRTSMAPPPRPPVLNTINNSSTTPSLLGVPSRGPIPNRQPQQQYDRQPGSSTLAPPPTHSSKPTKPSRKVTLEPGRSPLDWARLANHPSSDLRGLGAGASYLRVTPSMLKHQTGRKGKDAWTALGGRVYNITPYLPFHPGGEPELLRVAGRDGSKLFGEIHPWVNYETMLASCLIGLLVEEHEARSSGEMDDMD